MNSPPSGSAHRFVALAALAAFVAVSSFALPSFTLTRSFSGNGAMLVHPGNIVDFTGFLPDALPEFGAVTVTIWLAVLALVGVAALAWLARGGCGSRGVAV
ncbi:MAG: hypothetical protein HC933_16160, partial [Pleurocapsa sp. SU_196_0]|nr:hypothetical protein [Pleurocapsa sp. SU_196_0]